MITFIILTIKSLDMLEIVNLVLLNMIKFEMFEVDEATVIHLNLLPAYIAKVLAGVVKHFRVLPTKRHFKMRRSNMFNESNPLNIF